ncbi:MAG: methylated-DNA--[protein]-cysteine S-methyltransferase [Chthoniobacter sp.]|nr:methylated-DNA--[protein]-cysteine S-methyltransferase [Chthoniobacter sp.]
MRKIKSRKTIAKRRKRPARGLRVDPSVEEIRFGVGRTSLGPMLVAFSMKGVVSISIGQDADQLLPELEEQFPQAQLVSAHRDDMKQLARVAEYIEAPDRGLDLPLDLRGTAFQKRVWRAVREIPVGQTSTYTEIARKIGSPKAIRAVGSACARCGLAFVIPCHRVMRHDGTFHSRDIATNTRVHALLAREAAAAAGKQRAGKVRGKGARD